MFIKSMERQMPKLNWKGKALKQLARIPQPYRQSIEDKTGELAGHQATCDRKFDR